MITGHYKNQFPGLRADMAVYSFENKKHMSSGSEGGMIITQNPDLAEKARKFAGGGFVNLTSDKSKLAAVIPEEFQSPDFIRHDALGLNYRISEFCAAIALAQFEKVDEKVNIKNIYKLLKCIVLIIIFILYLNEKKFIYL